MTDLKTNTYYGATPQMLQNPGAVQVKNHLGNNTIGKVVGGVHGEGEKKDPLASLKTLLYGFLAAFGVTKVTNKLVRGDTFTNSKFGQFLGEVDNFSNNDAIQNAGKRFKSIGNWYNKSILTSPIRNLIGYFKNHASNIQPVRDMARTQSRTLGGELIDHLITHSKEMLSKKDSDLAKTLLEKVIKGEQTPKAVFGELSKFIDPSDTKAAEELVNSLGTGKISLKKASKNLLKIFKGPNSSNIQGINRILEKYKYADIGKISEKTAYEEILNFVKDKKIDVDDTFKLIKNKTEGITGYVMKNGRIKENGRSVLSKAFRGFYSGVNRFFNLGAKPLPITKKNIFPVLMTSYFVGDAIKQAVDAPWGDKFKTFTENVAGEVIPFWMLMGAMTRFPYQAADGLRKFGSKLNPIVKFLTSPVRGIGHLLSIGVAKAQLTPMMTEDAAKKLFSKSKEKNAFETFEKLKKSIKQGINVGESKKALKDLFKKAVPGWKRALIKLKNFSGGSLRFLAIMFVIMPFVSEGLKKISHKIFGKPQKTIEEEKKAEAEAKAEEAKNQAQTIPPQNLINNTQPTNTPPPLVKKYLDQKYNIGAGGLVNAPAPAQQSYFAVPQPIGNTPPETTARLNTVLAKIDKATQDY